MRRLHRTACPFAWLALLVLAVPLVAARRTCRPAFA
ncbi:peptidase, partial [Stenotrophomonas maltophilia]